jgi:hypothetical protein
MRDDYEASGIEDRGGRRLGIDRRQSPIVDLNPEWRSGEDRRSGVDRRSGKEDVSNFVEFRRRIDAYIEFLRTQKGLFWGICCGLSLWGLIILIILKII